MLNNIKCCPYLKVISKSNAAKNSENLLKFYSVIKGSLKMQMDTAKWALKRGTAEPLSIFIIHILDMSSRFAWNI